MPRDLRLTPAFFHLLLCLADGPRHGYGLMQEIESRTEGRVRLGPGSLYYALGRLEDAGLIREAAGAAVGDQGAEGAASEDAPHEQRRRYYELTPEGRHRLREEMQVMAGIVAHARASRLLLL